MGIDVGRKTTCFTNKYYVFSDNEANNTLVYFADRCNKTTTSGLHRDLVTTKAKKKI